jgi:hypothetical protein
MIWFFKLNPKNSWYILNPLCDANNSSANFTGTTIAPFNLIYILTTAKKTNNKYLANHE